MLATTIVQSTGGTLRAGTYHYQSDVQRSRHDRTANRPSGEVVLWELIPILQELGVPLPEALEPRSVYRPEMLIEPLKRYLQPPDMTQARRDVLRQAFEKVRRMFYVGELKPIDLERVSFHGTTNAGAPYFTQKKDAYWESLSEARAIRKGKAPEPLTVFHRGKNRHEARPVFGYPFSVTLIESTFFEAYQCEIVKHHSPYVGGQPSGQIAAYINEMRWKSDAILELDYSGFDGSLSAPLISMAFSIIKANFPTLTCEQEKDWQLVTRYFQTAPMLMPDGSLILGRRHGVASGSMFTQLVDSICNAIIVEYVARRLAFKPRRYFVLGDDSVIGLSTKVQVSDVVRVAAELGIIVNEKKSRAYWVRATERTYFLGHYRDSFLMKRSQEESVLRLLTPERLRPEYFSDDPDVRRMAYVERLRAYQDDNLLTWTNLELVILRLIGKAKSPWASLWFEDSKEYLERKRWDPGFIAFSRQRLKSETPRFSLATTV